MIKKHENKEGKNPIDFFIQEATFAQKVLKEKKIEIDKVNGYKRIEALKLLTSQMNQKYRNRMIDSYVFVGSLFVNRNDVKIVSISNNNAGIKLSDGDLVVPLYLKLETLFDKEITDLKLEQMIEDTVSLFSELEDKIIEHYFHSFSLFDFDLDFINALFSEIKINYSIDYFVKDNLELESEKVIKLDGKKDLPSFGIVIHLTNNQSKNIINSIISYLLKQVDTNCLLSQIIQKIKNNSSNHNRSFLIILVTLIIGEIRSEKEQLHCLKN